MTRGWLSALSARLGARWFRERTIERQIASLPPHYIGAIGQGDFRRVGEDLVAMFRAVAGLGPGDRVLDMGCGLGRVAIPLQRLLRRGSYHGFDVLAPMVEWDREHIQSVSPRFRFDHLDVVNSSYNPEGRVAPEAVSFPYPDARFTFACATSLFSHLLEAATLRYFAELARVLAPGGRAVLTFFLLDEEARARVEAGVASIAFTHAWDRGRLASVGKPEDAVAYDPEWLLARLGDAGLAARPVLWGRWSGRPDGFDYQDVVVVDRLPASQSM